MTYSYRTGRSDLGNLRNYKAMNTAKLTSVFATVLREDNDREAILALASEVTRRLLLGV